MHPTRRQIFAGKPYSTFCNIRDLLIPIKEHTVNLTQAAVTSQSLDFDVQITSPIFLCVVVVIADDSFVWTSSVLCFGFEKMIHHITTLAASIEWKVSLLNNIDEKQALSKSIHIYGVVFLLFRPKNDLDP